MLKLNIEKKEFPGKIIFEQTEIVIQKGDFVGIKGASGSGKSTLLKSFGEKGKRECPAESFRLSFSGAGIDSLSECGRQYPNAPEKSENPSGSEKNGRVDEVDEYFRFEGPLSGKTFRRRGSARSLVPGGDVGSGVHSLR